MKRERRKFLKLVATGAAAAVAASAPRPLRAAAEKASRKPAQVRGRAKKDARAEAIEAEVRRQKDYLAASLGTIRDYPLDPGSEPAFVFAPLSPKRPGRGGGR